MPAVVSLHRRVRGKAVEFLSISLDYRKEKAEETVKEQGIEFPVVFSGRGWDDPLVGRFQVDSIPHNFILDGELNIIGENLFGPGLAKALGALAEGDLSGAQTVIARAEREREALNGINRLLRLGKTAEARAAMEAFLAQFPDSEHAPAVRSYQASAREGEGLARGKPDAQDLRPPAPDLPPQVFVPSSFAGLPDKTTAEYLRYIARALEAYREDTGRYPTTLTALAQRRAYLSDVPPDPYGGEFRYRTDGKRYWIVAGKGPDGIEDPRIDDYRGDPRVLEGRIYRGEENESSPRGDIVAYRAAPGAGG